MTAYSACVCVMRLWISGVIGGMSMNSGLSSSPRTSTAPAVTFSCGATRMQGGRLLPRARPGGSARRALGGRWADINGQGAD